MPEFVRRAGRIARYLADEEPVVAMAAVTLFALVFLGVAIAWPLAGAVILIAGGVGFVAVTVPYVVRGVRDAARKTKEAADG